MSVRVDRESAPTAVWSACGDDVVGVVAERECLSASDEAAYSTGDDIGVGFAVLVERHHFVELYDDTVEITVVGDSDGSDDEVECTVCRRVVQWNQVERVGQRNVPIGEVGEKFTNEVRDRGYLLFLALQRHDFTLTAHLDEKDALTRPAECRRGERIRRVEVAVHRHEGRRSARDPPVELTVRTMGEPAP